MIDMKRFLKFLLCFDKTRFNIFYSVNFFLFLGQKYMSRREDYFC